MDRSLRHRILAAMADTFRAVDQPDWPLKFSLVELGPLGDEDHRKRYTLGIVPGPERYTHNFPYVVRFLRVAIEFRVTVNRDDEAPGELAEQLLTVIERVVIKNGTWGDLALATELSNSEIDMTTYSDRSVAGVLFVEIQYRHSHLDPRNPDPDVY